MASLSLRELRKTFGADTVVDGVSIDVADGEFVVLVGPSGCGKSTTLRMIAGLEGVDGGEIRIGDRLVNDIHPADRDVAMVFQSYALYPHMNVYDNISYGLRRRGLAKSEIARRVANAAGMLRLEQLMQRRPAQLSGGQRQRVALGRAIVRQPSVFLMDEPLSNLDAKLRVEMRAELSRLHAELGVTTIYVTHDQVEAMTMGSRIVVMNGGRREQIGEPLHVYHKPAALFVARFLGLPEINIIAGNVATETGGTFFTGADMRFALPGGDAPQGSVLLGLRPQSLFGSTTPHPPGAIVLGEATVTAIEHHGPESFASCLIGGTPLTVRVTPGAITGIGTPLSIAADLSNLHFFSPATDQRLEPSQPGNSP
jgi:ABC-type sugar transport system ATPase subunit